MYTLPAPSTFSGDTYRIDAYIFAHMCCIHMFYIMCYIHMFYIMCCIHMFYIMCYIHMCYIHMFYIMCYIHMCCIHMFYIMCYMHIPRSRYRTTWTVGAGSTPRYPAVQHVQVKRNMALDSIPVRTQLL